MRKESATPWAGAALAFSFVPLPPTTTSQQRHEIENDLIGGYDAQTATAPRVQFTPAPFSCR